MSLKACPECKHEISASAASCPSCGHPLKKPQSSGLKKLLVLAVLVSVVVLVYDRLLPQKAKDAVNLVAASTGVKITPWSDRAQAVLNTYSAASRNEIAESALKILHPTGHFTGSSQWQAVEKNDDLILVFSVGWRGGITKAQYATSIEWQASENGHVKATVSADTAPFKAAAGNRDQLDAYFETTVWPAIHQATGG